MGIIARDLRTGRSSVCRGLVTEVTVQAGSCCVTQTAVLDSRTINLGASQTAVQGLVARTAEGAVSTGLAHYSAVLDSGSEGNLRKTGKDRQE